MTAAEAQHFPAPFDRLLADVEEIGPVYQEHLDDYGTVIAHVLMGDVSRFFNEHLRAAVASAPGQDGSEAIVSEAIVRSVLGSLEASLTGADGAVTEVISASFLENLDQEDDEYDRARSLMGPRLLALLEAIETG